MKNLNARSWAALLCGAGVLAAAPVMAHHSFAMFDNKNVTLVGTVRTYEWSNPHTWLWVNVTQVDGKPVSDGSGPQVWGLEGTAPGELSRQGRTKEEFKAGDKVTVEIRPLKDGRHGGSLGKVTFADGHSVGGGGFGGGGAGGPPGGAPPGAPPGGAQ